AWSEKNPVCILHEFNDFSTKIYPFNNETYNQFNDIRKYWNFAAAFNKGIRNSSLQII
ncbi:6711_t:CDS:1, partial [Cetraspora pellucida]